MSIDPSAMHRRGGHVIRHSPTTTACRTARADPDGLMASGAQTLRLRRPDSSKPTPPQPTRHTGVLQDQLRRYACQRLG